MKNQDYEELKGQLQQKIDKFDLLTKGFYHSTFITSCASLGLIPDALIGSLETLVGQSQNIILQGLEIGGLACVALTPLTFLSYVMAKTESNKLWERRQSVLAEQREYNEEGGDDAPLAKVYSFDN